MKIAIEGCAHGELENIYESIAKAEEHIGCKIDLLICCGDFQATRNTQDLSCMAVPQKYQHMCSFHKYYSGEKIAPVLTLFIGGNHEASNHLQELPYGGWAAPNIYYLGYAGVVTVGGIRIGGLSGIFKGHDYTRGRFERPPYTEQTKRSVYHVRSVDVFRLKQMKMPVDIMMSHDWPRGVYNYGDVELLIRNKPFFREDIDNDRLGSVPAKELLHSLKPKYWFAAHLHTKFAAIIKHEAENDEAEKFTKFLALDKCLPKRSFLQVVDIPHDSSKSLDLEYDLEWLTILYLTNHLLSVKHTSQFMPGPGSNERWIFSPTTEEMSEVLKRLDGDLKVPSNFVCTVPPYSPNESSNSCFINQNSIQLNPQTIELCEKLSLTDPLALLNVMQGSRINNSSFNSSIMSPGNMTPNKTGTPDKICTPDTTCSPEKTDASFVDSETSSPQSCNVSFNDFESPLPSKLNRSALFLPPPKHWANDNSDEECGVKRCSSQSSNLDDSQDSQMTDTTDANSDTNTAVPERKTKMFKRRNQALYKNTDEDEY